MRMLTGARDRRRGVLARRTGLEGYPRAGYERQVRIRLAGVTPLRRSRIEGRCSIKSWPVWFDGVSVSPVRRTPRAVCSVVGVAVPRRGVIMAQEAPAPPSMDRAGDSAKALGAYESLLVSQTRKGCIQELLGCEATNEFKIYPSKEQVRCTNPDSAAPPAITCLYILLMLVHWARTALLAVQWGLHLLLAGGEHLLLPLLLRESAGIHANCVERHQGPARIGHHDDEEGVDLLHPSHLVLCCGRQPHGQRQRAVSLLPALDLS